MARVRGSGLFVLLGVGAACATMSPAPANYAVQEKATADVTFWLLGPYDDMD